MKCKVAITALVLACCANSPAQADWYRLTDRNKVRQKFVPAKPFAGRTPNRLEGHFRQIPSGREPRRGFGRPKWPVTKLTGVWPAGTTLCDTLPALRAVIEHGYHPLCREYDKSIKAEIKVLGSIPLPGPEHDMDMSVLFVKFNGRTESGTVWGVMGYGFGIDQIDPDI